MVGRIGPLAAFAALAGFAAAHWAALVAEPPATRVALVVVVATAGGMALANLPRGTARPRRAALARIAVAAVTLCGALAAIGVPPELLWPGGWGELWAGASRGLGGVRTIEWPYSGRDEWVRLTVLLAIPLALSAAATLTFWSARSRVAGALGLSLLLCLYGIGVAQHATGAPLVRGALLLALIVAWLFLPRIRRGGAVAAAGMTLVALAASLPLAAALTADQPILDYRDWRWLGQPASYDWNHGYGPIDWPRRGETVLTIEAQRPHYWKATALDRFDGLRWVRSESALSTGSDPGLPADPPRRWESDAEVTVGALDTTLIAAPGSVRDVHGAGGVTLTRDGGARAEQELEQGSTYRVRAYAPDPGAERMRAAPEPSSYVQRPYTIIHLPPEGRTNLDVLREGGGAEASSPGRPVVLPRHSDGLGATPGAEDYVRASPYARVYALAEQLGAGAPTTYDLVRRVESHLRESYVYSEQPPDREYPLAAFLFEDRAGYCQQFSGAMALLLRMNGVPARVASGFAPGSRSSDGETFTVRDLDAHSWVEVHFAGIGWVPFDPTPAGAPAESRADGTLASAARGDGGGLDLSDALPGSDSPDERQDHRPETGEERAGAGGGGSVLERIVAALLATGAGAACIVLAARRRVAGRSPDAPVHELRRALERLGHPIAPGTTLMDLERRLAAGGRAAAARYVRLVREQRFAGGAPWRDPAARRALRAALTAGAGPLRRVRGYLVLPPRRAWSDRRMPFMTD